MCLMGKGITLISHPRTVFNPPSIIPLPSSSLLISLSSSLIFPFPHIPFPLSLPLFPLRLPPLTFIFLLSSSFFHPPHPLSYLSSVIPLILSPSSPSSLMSPDSSSPVANSVPVQYAGKILVEDDKNDHIFLRERNIQVYSSLTTCV